MLWKNGVGPNEVHGNNHYERTGNEHTCGFTHTHGQCWVSYFLKVTSYSYKLLLIITSYFSVTFQLN